VKDALLAFALVLGIVGGICGIAISAEWAIERSEAKRYAKCPVWQNHTVHVCPICESTAMSFDYSSYPVPHVRVRCVTCGAFHYEQVLPKAEATK
jgi:hypothetical protein